jgi:hypothetical protein
MTRTLAPCETCNQRVGVVANAQGSRRRLVRHKSSVPLGRFRRVDWCPGQFERVEAKR